MEGVEGEEMGWEKKAHAPTATPPQFDSQIFERSQYEKQSDVTCPQTLPDPHNHVKELHPMS